MANRISLSPLNFGNQLSKNASLSRHSWKTSRRRVFLKHLNPISVLNGDLRSPDPAHNTIVEPLKEPFHGQQNILVSSQHWKSTFQKCFLVTTFLENFEKTSLFKTSQSELCVETAAISEAEPPDKYTIYYCRTT
jgi:hypothetical protein